MIREVSQLAPRASAEQFTMKSDFGSSFTFFSTPHVSHAPSIPTVDGMSSREYDIQHCSWTSLLVFVISHGVTAAAGVDACIQGLY